MSKQIKQKKGFTIIEVVLVLAIAGLIFLMVFFVLPQAMAGQRDAERRQAMSRVQSALVQYQTNNKSKRNNLPPAGTATEPETGFCEGTSACSFIKNYLNASGAEENLFVDPDGVPYNMVIADNASTSAGLTALANTKYNDNSTLKAGDAEGEYTIGGNDPFKEHVIYVIPGAECVGESVRQSELRHFAVLYRLENSGTYCGDSD